jgi:hypothetical protein
MRTTLVRLAGLTLTILTGGCGGSPEPEGGGTASVLIGDRTFKSSNVIFTYAIGEDAYFRIEGDDAAHPREDCVPGLAGVLALYGELPANISSLSDLNGRELPFEFSGDGDDANLCFVGSHGLLGVETGTVQFTAVEETKVSFSFSGTFGVYDGEGGRSPDISASGQGIAHVTR